MTLRLSLPVVPGATLTPLNDFGFKPDAKSDHERVVQLPCPVRLETRKETLDGFTLLVFPKELAFQDI